MKDFVPNLKFENFSQFITKWKLGIHIKILRKSSIKKRMSPSTKLFFNWIWDHKLNLKKYIYLKLPKKIPKILKKLPKIQKKLPKK